MNTTTQRPTLETDAEVKRIQADQSIFVCEEFNVLSDFARKLECERDEAREQIQMTLKHDAERLESDSIVGSCDCLTKTPEVKYHKPGCKYRLISERDEALAANFRQAICLHQCAASIGHDTSFSVDALPNAVKRVVRERDEAREELENILNVIPADAPCLHAETGETIADYILGMQKEVGRVHALYFNGKQQLEAMRGAIREAWVEMQYAEAGFAGLALRVCPNDSAVESVLNRMTEALDKLQPLLP